MRIELAIAGERVQKELAIPRGPTRPLRMLPVFQAVADEVLLRATRATEAEGKTISCRLGCAACCRQIIPVSETEALRLAEIVEALPAPRREAVRARFTEARQALEARGLWERLLGFRTLDEEAMERLGLDTLDAYVACPFLEGEACSIHEERPLSCREFLVTSPAEHCRHPTPETIAPVELPGHASDALARLALDEPSDARPEPRTVFWMPLVFALSFAEERPDTGPERPGIAWLNDFLNLLAALSEPEETSEAPGEKPDATRSRPSGARGRKDKRGKKKSRGTQGR